MRLVILQTYVKSNISLFLQQRTPPSSLMMRRCRSYHISNQNANKRGKSAKESVINQEATTRTESKVSLSSSSSTTTTSIFQRFIDPNNSLLTKPLLETFPQTSVAVLCGHAAFILTGLAYVTKDILLLRTMAMSGISMTMIFQYYRPQPLFLPLRWNALFLGINAIMVSMLIQERYEAYDMDEELVQMYQSGLFEKRGFTRVEFYRLFGLAKKQERKKGDFLQKFGMETNQLCYIEHGSASISKHGSLLAKLSENDFTGEMEFIQYMTVAKDDSVNENDDEIQLRDNDEIQFQENIASADIIVESEKMTIWVWEFDDLKEFLPAQRAVSNALLAYISHELREKLVDSWVLKEKEDAEKAQLQQAAVNFLFDELKK